MIRIVGIDEVGRGCWAGPLVAGAVLLNRPIKGLKDSKVLSAKVRQKLAEEIRSSALAYGLGWVEAEVIDQIGLTAATSLAMERALSQITEEYDEVIIDGHINFLSGNSKTRAIIKADSLVQSVSAASILAKVARDDYMKKLALEHPHYGFDSHVGYGTALHLERLRRHGISLEHRKSFKPIKIIMNAKSS